MTVIEEVNRLTERNRADLASRDFGTLMYGTHIALSKDGEAMIDSIGLEFIESDPELYGWCEEARISGTVHVNRLKAILEEVNRAPDILQRVVR